MKFPQLAAVILLTLLPWPVVWFGLYFLKSAVGTFALYHGLCLIPAAVAGRSLWRHQLRLPTLNEWIVLSIAMIVVPALAVLLSFATGDLVVSKSFLMNSLNARGYSNELLVPICLYLIFVNGPLEELFWRGVIYNLESLLDKERQWGWRIWTAVSFAAWHFLVLSMLLTPGWALPMTILFSFVGLFLGQLMQYSKSLVLVSLWHGLVFDGAVVAVFIAVLLRSQ